MSEDRHATLGVKPTTRTARSGGAVADLPIGARSGLRHHRGTANEKYRCVDGPCDARGFFDVSSFIRLFARPSITIAWNFSAITVSRA